jgi:hypothetical protein
MKKKNAKMIIPPELKYSFNASFDIKALERSPNAEFSIRSLRKMPIYSF